MQNNSSKYIPGLLRGLGKLICVMTLEQFLVHSYHNICAGYCYFSKCQSSFSDLEVSILPTYSKINSVIARHVSVFPACKINVSVIAGAQ